MKYKTIDSLTEIPSVNYEGYVWGSDDQYPTVLKDAPFDFSKTGANPYVLEALLYNKKNNTSIMIRHSGKYHITEFYLNEIPEENKVLVTYLPHRLRGVDNVFFQQLWIPEKDPLCKGMEVLTLKALIFIGFVEPLKNENNA